MLKKIFHALLILLAILLLLMFGWIFQVYYDWPAGSMYLWPVSVFTSWGLFILVRKFWVNYRAAQRLKTQLPPEELAAADPDWTLGVQQLLVAQHNQDYQYRYIEELTLSVDLPHLQAFITGLDDYIIEILNGNRLLFLLDFDWTHKLLIRLHQNLVDTLERDRIGFLSAIPGFNSLFGRRQPQKSVLGPHKIHFVFGMVDSGKSTLIQRSSFGAHVGESNPDADIAPTKSCRLAFLEPGIVVEVSGKHVDPELNSSDCDAGWNSLLASISADINTHQIASVVVCISAEELSNIKAGNTYQGMQIIRRRISDLMGLSGKRLPVYLVLTKVDLIGFSPLIQVLPENLLGQPAGDLLPADRISISNSSAEDSIREITRYLPWLALRCAATGRDPGQSALIATHGLLNIQEALDGAILSLFGASNYLETSIYRGLFLSSELAKAGVEVDRKSDAPRLAFGSGVLNDVLLRDRIFQPLTSYERNIKHRQKMMWFAYYSLVCAIVVWLGAGFAYQSNQMLRIKNLELPVSAKHNDPVEVYVNAIVGMEPYVRWVLEREVNPWNFFLPFSGVTNEIETQIKKRFVINYRAFELEKLAAKFLEYYENASAKDESLIGVAINSLLGRIKIIEAVMAKEPLARVITLPKPGGRAISFFFPSIPRQQVNAITSLEYFYIYWVNQESDLNSLLSEVRKFLEFAAQRDQTLGWIIPWAAIQPDVVDVWLSDFWTPTSGPQGIKLPGPYTIQGKTAINALIRRMNEEPILNKIYGAQSVDFLQQYETRREIEWRQFLLGFDSGRNLLATSSAWRDILTTFGGENSPYARMSNRILQEYPQSESIMARPGWVSSIEFIQALRQSALNTSLIGDLKGKLKVWAAISKLQNSKNEPQDESLIDSRDLYRTYIDAMDKALNTALSSPSNAASLAVDFSGLGSEPSIKVSAMRNVSDALQRLEDKIGVKAQPWNAPGWVLLEGSMKTTLAYAYNQAACSMQSAWNGNVIYPTKLATSEGEMFQKTFGEQGTLWTFIDKTAKPFLTIGGSDFINIVVDGWYLNWDAGFITFLNNAASEKRMRDAATKKAELEDKLANTRDNAKINEINGRIQDIEANQAKFNQTTFTVKIDSIPVQANSLAKSMPFGVALSLSCGANQQRLTQLNFSISNNFTWKANTCGDTELQIFVGEQTLSKVWPGEYGFSQFLSDFQTGKKTFLANKFPDQSQALEQLGIKQIDVFFKLSGASSFIEAARANQNEAVELAKIKAEKAKLEKAIADRQVNKISNEIASLMNGKNKPVIPEKVANCPY